MQERFAQDEINRLLDLDNEALCRLPFTLSAEAALLRTRQDELLLRNAGARLTEETLTGFMWAYGDYAVLLMPSSHYHVQEYALYVETLVIDRLTRPITLEKVYEEIEDFFLPNTEGFMDKMAYFCMTETGDKLRGQFHQLVLQILKKYISVGVLVPAEAPVAVDPAPLPRNDGRVNGRLSSVY
jgi:hypothetical protein